MIDPVQIQIRFADIDSMGHVNNAVYLSYFEFTRVYYFNKLLGKNWDWDSKGIILAHTELSFIKPIELNDKAFIEIEIGNIGTKSFTFHYTIQVDGQITTKGSSTLVAFNTKLQKSMAIPAEMKASFEALKVFQS
ncbi:MAG: acyl-CoA thioesterase [Crocinitomicaceae bacterium]|nr:acyl-CoA thioesterase [Crocinitomicaceae bacterium]|tara:strand:+ start:53 stop:457 length:405 start_codon:yes stop_codon:yes gene_type:complete